MEETLSGPFGLIIFLFLFVWAVLMFLSPFFWYGTNQRTKEISQKMDELIKIQRRTFAQRGRAKDNDDKPAVVTHRPAKTV